MSVLIFTGDGLGHGLYAEGIDLSAIGALRIERATAIEFDNDAQRWRVRDSQGVPLFDHPSRQACLDWEREYLERREEARHD